MNALSVLGSIISIRTALSKDGVIENMAREIAMDWNVPIEVVIDTCFCCIHFIRGTITRRQLRCDIQPRKYVERRVVCEHYHPGDWRVHEGGWRGVVMTDHNYGEYMAP